MIILKKVLKIIIKIKYFLLIINNFLSKFWIEIIDIASYLQNNLPTKY